MRYSSIPLVVAALSAAVLARAETPYVLVPSGVTDFSLREPKVFWHTTGICAGGIDGGPPAGAELPEVISRIASAGSNVREILEVNPPRPANVCNPYHILSNVVADDDHVYFVDDSGLVRLSTDANPPDAPELLSSEVAGTLGGHPVELGLGPDDVFAITRIRAAYQVWRVDKESGAAAILASESAFASRPSSDGEFAYWLAGGELRRYRLAPGRTNPLSTIAGSGVTAYYAEGRRWFLGGTETKYVFFARGRRIYRYNNVGGSTSAALYTSEVSSAVIYSIRSTGGGGIVVVGGPPAGIFFFERRENTCADCIFTTYAQLLFRIPRSGGDGELLYLRNSSLPAGTDNDFLTSNGTYLFWQDRGRVLRLPADAEAIPKTNMRVTGLEVTQGIQDLSHSVRLIRDRRTFVRVYAKSDDPQRSVPGVRCTLSGAWNGGSGGPLDPVNPTGMSITVNPNPDRADVNQSFLFELPWSWTRTTNLVLTARLNPHKSPPQESYANNVLVSQAFNFDESPRFAVQFVAFEFDWNGTTYTPRLFEDIYPAFSWVRRAFPLASAPGSLSDPSPGLRTGLWYVFDEDLGAKVDRSASDCLSMPADDRSLCASAYTNSRLLAWQAEHGGSSRHYYGWIADGHKFPRGQAPSGATVASGPTGSMCCGAAWDTDGTYADWYTGHELGHTLGRGHPQPASDDPSTDEVREGCGHDAGDPNYPYSGAFIGPAGGSLMGFDGGNSSLPPQALPRNVWTDLMSYCDFQWISDYTYNALYDRMMATGSGGGAGEVAGAGGGLRGDFLGVFGAVLPHQNTASIHHLRRMSKVASLPRPGRGGFLLEQLDAQGGVLDETPFGADAGADSDGEVAGFQVIAPFAARVRSVRIVRLEDGQVLASKQVSASPPVVESVEITSSSFPASGAFTVEWQAGDADGDKLSFDLLYSLDLGQTFQPLQFNVKELSSELDATRLGGGTAIVRVVASDGVHTAEADSPAFEVAPKPPVPRILLPEDGKEIEFGQLVNFLGVADDLQDGTVAPSGLRWDAPGRRLVSGPFFSSDRLPVGVNTIRLIATNSLGLSASDEVTVIVRDDLAVPGPTLTVAPLTMGWHLPAPASALLRGTLSVANAGSGGISWTASTDAEWLQVLSPSGQAPAVIALLADTSGFEYGESAVAEVIVSQVGGTGQSIVVRVTFSVGDTFHSHEDDEDDGGDGTELFRRGDSNGDGRMDIADPVNTLDYLYAGTGVVTCPDAADFDDDGELAITDAIAGLLYLFSGGRPPAPPGGAECGRDPTADELAACEYLPDC